MFLWGKRTAFQNVCSQLLFLSFRLFFFVFFLCFFVFVFVMCDIITTLRYCSSYPLVRSSYIVLASFDLAKFITCAFRSGNCLGVSLCHCNKIGQKTGDLEKANRIDGVCFSGRQLQFSLVFALRSLGGGHLCFLGYAGTSVLGVRRQARRIEALIAQYLWQRHGHPKERST